MLNHYCIKNHKHCINRGKLLDLLKLEYEILVNNNYKNIITSLINKIENGDFDND